MNVQNDNFQENVETIQTELVTGEHDVFTASVFSYSLQAYSCIHCRCIVAFIGGV